MDCISEKNQHQNLLKSKHSNKNKTTNTQEDQSALTAPDILGVKCCKSYL